MAVLIMATEITGHGWGPGPWRPIFPLFWLFVPGIVIFAVLRFRGRGPWQRGHAAENVLAERYAARRRHGREIPRALARAKGASLLTGTAGSPVMFVTASAGRVHRRAVV
jgi:putative membrane protein